MNRKRFGERQVGEKEAGGQAKDSFADSIAGDESPTRRNAGGTERRMSQQPQMGDDAQQKRRGRVGDFR